MEVCLLSNSKFVCYLKIESKQDYILHEGKLYSLHAEWIDSIEGHVAVYVHNECLDTSTPKEQKE